MRVAYNDSDDRAGLRGYVQFNKYTYILLRQGSVTGVILVGRSDSLGFHSVT